MVKQEDLINGYMFDCVRCGDRKPIRYAGAQRGSKFFICLKCLAHDFTCTVCGKECASIEESTSNSVCLDCYDDGRDSVEDLSEEEV